MENKKYEGWLVSNSLIKRSVAVWGHFMLGYIIIVFSIAIPVMIISVIFAL